MANNTRRIHIRVTDEEYAELLRQKEFMKLPSYSDLIRMYNMKDLELEVAKVTKEKAHIVKYIARETGCGGNLGSY